MLSADAEFQILLYRAAFLDGNFDNLADAALIEAGEWVLCEDVFFFCLLYTSDAADE